MTTTPSITVESSGVWIFQASIKNYKFLDALRTGKNTIAWRVTRFGNYIRKGDTVLFWMSGPSAGIYAVGSVASDPAVMDPDPWEEVKNYYTTEYARECPDVLTPSVRALVTYSKKMIDDPLLKDDLKHHPTLKNLSVIKQPQGTNFKVTTEQWLALKKLLYS